MGSASATPEGVWLETWRQAGADLEERRRQDLRELSPERARLYTEAVLAAVSLGDLPQSRRRWSGLVAQQKLFARLKGR
jgi:hypothetical protein